MALCVSEGAAGVCPAGGFCEVTILLLFIRVKEPPGPSGFNHRFDHRFVDHRQRIGKPKNQGRVAEDIESGVEFPGNSGAPLRMASGLKISAWAAPATCSR